jgi:ABC-type antimicrobial peptide transport system permease subunit
LGYALRWALLGVVIGLLGSVAAARILKSLLFQVPANDPGLIGGAAVLMLAVTVAATLLPSLRAARIDPMLALRQE